MKKFGFTLAELLISLTIIGIVATLTIPTVVQRNQAKANFAKLATSVSAIENALSNMIVAEGAYDITETDFFVNNEIQANHLERYLKFSDTAHPDGSLITEEGTFCLLKNGVTIAITTDPVPAVLDFHPGSVGFIDIDVNGESRPNAFGADCFRFRIGNNGSLYPAGSDMYSNMGIDNTDTNCQNGRGTFCTDQVVRNNYKID